MTTYSIPPSYGADFVITEEGKIAIIQDQPGVDNVAIYLSAEETKQAITALQQLLLQLEQES